ncbi:hypothetical protein [Mucilaginibacter sp.]|uniref:hypothetical protein n=1 Tax=Mucilaginibacter sp. TaxID=1882438 RepID=UPI0032662BAB
METTIEKFDRANNQGKNHDTKGNIANADNDMVKPETDDTEKQMEIPTVTPDNDNEELENPQPQNASNKGQGPAGENL